MIAIHEDRSHVLWLGTSSGLNRFDRATGQFTVYHHNPGDPHSLAHDTVRVITEDRAGGLWVGTLGGLSRFDRATATFTTYRHDPANPRSLSHNVVWDIREDRAGRLWVGTDGGRKRMTRAKVLLADDNTMVAKSLDRLLRDDFELVATVGDGQTLVDTARRLRPDVIVADIEMPVMGGLEALRQLRTNGVDAPILFLTAHRDAQLAVEAMRAGAAGFVLKHTAGDELIHAIGEILEGRIYMSALMSERSMLKRSIRGARAAAFAVLLPAQAYTVTFVLVGFSDVHDGSSAPLCVWLPPSEPEKEPLP